MTGRILSRVLMIAIACVLRVGATQAQDVPGIEICTAEKKMERRTSCLQSNVNFLQGTISRLVTDSGQKIDAANRRIEALETTVAELRKTVAELQEARKKQPQPPVKEGGKDNAKESGK
ncbi:MAG: hypothetical protein BGN91_11750 [Nitrobacter sp. 62-13]|jgi:TolA-binding protein|nr:MAG: hypothetical protein BGN91_11750 [Nitrobacter sp. 62-13]